MRVCVFNSCYIPHAIFPLCVCACIVVQRRCADGPPPLQRIPTHGANIIIILNILCADFGCMYITLYIIIVRIYIYIETHAAKVRLVWGHCC